MAFDGFSPRLKGKINEMVKTQKAAFLDRDGVLNKAILRNGKPIPPRQLEEIELCDGTKEAIGILRSLQFEIIVITNQPDISRGNTTEEFVNTIHKVLSDALKINHFYVCAHDNSDHCECRKPLPGLIKRAGNDLRINMEQSILVGDRWSDIEAGQTIGCQCFYINNNYQEKKPKSPYFEVNSLLEVAKYLLKGSF